MGESGTEVGRTTAAASWIERFFDLSRDLFVVADAAGRIVLANGACRRVLGYEAEAISGRPYLDFVHPDDVETTLAAGERLDAGGELPLLENRVIRRDGEYRWLRWSATCDRATGVVYAAGRDVTDLKRAGEQLHESRRRLEAVLDTAPVILWALDAEGRFTLGQGRGLTSVAGEPGSMVGRSVFEVYAHAPEVCDNNRRALAGETFTAVVEVDGRVYETHYAPLTGPDGEPDGALGVAHDVTDRRRLEERYRTLVETSDEMIWATDAGGRLTFTNGAVEEVLG